VAFHFLCFSSTGQEVRIGLVDYQSEHFAALLLIAIPIPIVPIAAIRALMASAPP
jgi:hypothetical protein